MEIDKRQRNIDTFYMQKGKCCAGCDHWRHSNSIAGECTKSAPVSGDQRWEMLGIESASLTTGAGHVATPRENVCGEFVDTFDWESLPVPYLRQIGYETAR